MKINLILQSDLLQKTKIKRQKVKKLKAGRIKVCRRKKRLELQKALDEPIILPELEKTENE